MYSLVPPEAQGGDGEFWGVERCPELGGRYLAPFVMQACNNRIVHRSNYLLGWCADSRNLRYREAVAASGWLGAKAVQWGTMAIVSMMSLTWLHPVLKKMLPAQGEVGGTRRGGSGHGRAGLDGHGQVAPARARRVLVAHQ